VDKIENAGGTEPLDKSEASDRPRDGAQGLEDQANDSPVTPASVAGSTPAAGAGGSGQ